jgi:hypothetical protein
VAVEDFDGDGYLAGKFGDFDNDGWPDRFVVNGLRSAGKENYIPVLAHMITGPGVDFTDLGNWSLNRQHDLERL